MKTIRTALLTALTVLSFGAFAAPAMAEDFVWTNEGVPIAESQAVGLEGWVRFGYQSAPVTCDVDAEASLEPGGGGSITSFDLSNCEFFYGSGWCKGGEGISSTVPWSIQAANGYWEPWMLIDSMSFTIEITDPACPAKPKFSVTNADITAKSSNEEASYLMSTLEFSGLNQGNQVFGIDGELTVTPSWVYGVEES